MTAEAPLLSRSWKVGRYIATLTVPKFKPGAQMLATIEWLPTAPDRLTAGELRDYVAGRNEVLAEAARELRLAVAVIDL